MLEAFDKAVKIGLQYVSYNGCYVALACYATGNVELGLIVDGIGFVKLPGAIISLELAYTKKGAFSLAKLSTWFEKYFVNMVSQFYFGIDIKK